MPPVSLRDGAMCARELFFVHFDRHTIEGQLSRASPV